MLPGAPCNRGIIPLITVNLLALAVPDIGNAQIQGVEFEGTYDAGDWFVGLRGQHIHGRDLTNGLPLLTVQPDQITTTAGLRLWDRKLTRMVK